MLENGIHLDMVREHDPELIEEIEDGYGEDESARIFIPDFYVKKLNPLENIPDQEESSPPDEIEEFLSPQPKN